MLPARNPNNAFLYQFLTLGFYFFYWCQRTGAEVNQLARQKLVPSAWWLAFPFFGGYWWMWHYAEALHVLSQKRIKKSDTFLLFVIVTSIYSIPLNIVRYLPNASNAKISTGAAITIICIFVAVVYVTSLIALGFFCSVIQKKLNTVFVAPPQAPQNPTITAPLNV